MTNYFPVAMYDTDGVFVAHAIMGEHKLQSQNVYRLGQEDQLNTQLERLNTSAHLKSHWPHPQDSEVKAILDDESFMPIEYVDQEVVDDDKSYYVWKKDHQDHDNEELDEEASVIVFKMASVPKRPTDVMVRLKAACEQVAKRRAGMLE